jgi:hypothetical protein
MATTIGELDFEEPTQQGGLIPYAPDFTPSTLGKHLSEDKVLEWLLSAAKRCDFRSALATDIGSTCLAHIDDPTNRRDMASHVVQALGNYQLIDVDEYDRVTLTAAGKSLLDAPGDQRDAQFARHILSMCGGYRLVEAIQRHELRGSRPTMESLNRELGLHPTEKSISSMRAWLAKAGVLSGRGTYSVFGDALAALVGSGVTRMLGMSPAQVEFLLAARILNLQTGGDALEAPDVKRLAETRAPNVPVPSKALGSFVRRLVDAGHVELVERARGKGGTRVCLRLTLGACELTDDQIRSLLAQSDAGMALADLGTIEGALAELAANSAEQRGRAGERVAVHICLMLGLRVTGWRNRLPVEVDLTAEREVGFSYQRWHVQVKNIDGDLTADRVDREIGASAGTGATHILFVVPRGGITLAARAEALMKSRLTHLHIYWLLADSLGASTPIAMIRALENQQAVVVREKRREAERRER